MILTLKVGPTPSEFAELTHIESGLNAGDNWGGYFAASAGKSTVVFRSLVQWLHLTTWIPAGSTINSATLNVPVMLFLGSARDLSAHRALTRWWGGTKAGDPPDAETDGSTWNHRNANGSLAWGAAGGQSGVDYATTPTATQNVTATGTYSFDVAADVAAWVAGTASNYGWWLLYHEAATNNIVYTTGRVGTETTRPSLTVDFTLPANSVVITATADTKVSKLSTNNNYGISTTGALGGGTTSWERILLSFPLTDIPAGATVTRALLIPYMTAQGATGGAYAMYAHRGLTQWWEGLKDGATVDGGTDGSTYNYRNVNGSVAWGAAGGGSGTDFAASPAASYTTVKGPDTHLPMDITAEVVAWLSGTTNYGVWLLGNEADTNAIKTFATREHTTAGYRPVLLVTYTPAATASGGGKFFRGGRRVL